MNDVIKTLTSRRSVRSYNDKIVPMELVEQIAMAGTYAPSGGGRQGSKMVVVTDEDTIAVLSALNAKVAGTDSDPFYGAKTVIIVFSDGASGTCVEDGSLIMGNLLNAAYSLGVQSCWIHRAKEVFEFEEGIELKKKWNIPDEYIGIGNCILGYSDEAAASPAPRKEDYIFYV